MFLRALHRTTYRYPFASRESHNEVRLMPLEGPEQRGLAFELTTDPPAKLFAYREQGGTVHHFVVRTPHTSLTIQADTAVETLLENPYEGLNLIEDDWAAAPPLAERYPEFLASTPRVPVLDAAREIAAGVRAPGPSVADWAIALGERIHDLLDYDTDATHVETPLSYVIEHRVGVCQDFAHLALACLRARGVPARYVSGYLYSDGDLRGDAATHAWVECALPGGRWLGLDPTNRCLANDHHIRVHTGRDYDEVPPTRGIYTGPLAERLEVSVSVTRLEAPFSFSRGDELPNRSESLP